MRVHYLVTYVTLFAMSAISTAPPPHHGPFDFIVVGAGTAGAYVARRLATSPAAPRVLLLEAGPDTLSNASSTPEKVKSESNPNYLSLIPGNWAANLATSRTNYFYLTAPQPELGDRRLVYHRGKGLGGSSTLNFMIWNKGYRGDFQEWADIAGDSAYGAQEGWERVKKLESFDPNGLPASYKAYAQPDIDNHGTGGTIHNSLPRRLIACMQKFIDACTEVGIPKTLDVNSGEPIGAGISQMAVFKGARSSSATQLLNKHGDIGAGLKRPSNLVVMTDTTVIKILFDGGKRAVGVITTGGNIFIAGKEVILSAGCIDSPKLLLLSGIGPKERLTELGITVVADNKNVGKNMLDHTTSLIDLVFNPDEQIPSNNALYADPDRLHLESLRWLNTYQGGAGTASSELVRYGSSAGIAFMKFPQSVRETWPEWTNLCEDEKSRFLDPKRPDTEFLMISGWIPAGRAVPLGREPSSYARVFQFHHNRLSRGSVTLRSANPNDAPVIDPGYFLHPMDVRIAVETVKLFLKVLRSSAFNGTVQGAEFSSANSVRSGGNVFASIAGHIFPVNVSSGVAVGPFLQPIPEKAEINAAKSVNGVYVNGIEETEEGIEKWLREAGLDLGYHGMGTCRMGKDGDPLRVVDSSGRVVGVHGLRVVDASVVPVMFNNHPQVCAYLVADIVADRIIDTWWPSVR